MKKFLSILLVALMSVAVVFTAVGCSETPGGNGKTGVLCTKEDGKYVVYKYVDDGTGVVDLDIESAVKQAYGENAEVIRIKEGAFDGNSTLKSVTVPTTVTEIDAGAFKNMKSLETLTLPFVGNNLISDAYTGQNDDAEIKAVDAERLFGSIFGKSEYTGGAKITQYYDGTTESNFYVPMTLRKIVIAPLNDHESPMYSFSGLTLISEISFSGKVVSIGERAFYNANCFSELKLPVSVKTLYKGAFEGFSSLQKIDFAGTLAQWNEVVKGENWNKNVSEYFTEKTA